MHSSDYSQPYPADYAQPSPPNRVFNEQCYYDQDSGAYIYPPPETAPTQPTYNQNNYQPEYQQASRPYYQQPPSGIPVEYSSQKESGCREEEWGENIPREGKEKRNQSPGCFARCCLG